MGTVRLLRGELHKLLHPGALLLIVVALAVIWQDASKVANFGKDQARVAVVVALDSRRAIAEQCAPEPAGNPGECKLLKIDAEDNRYFERNGRDIGAVAQSLNSYPGILTLVSHELGTGVGIFLLAALAVFHVTREFSSGTSTLSIATAGVARFIAAKVASLFIVMAGVIFGGAALLHIARPTFAENIGVPRRSVGPKGAYAQPTFPLRPDETWSSLSHAMNAALTALLMLAIVALVVTAITIQFRRPTTALLASVAVPVLLFIAARQGYQTNTSPLYQASRLLRIDQNPYGIADARLWDLSGQIPDLYSLRPSPSGSMATLLLWALLFVSSSLLLMWRMANRRVIA